MDRLDQIRVDMADFIEDGTVPAEDVGWEWAKALLGEVDALTADLNAAIREIGVWAKKAGLAEAERDALRARVEELETTQLRWMGTVQGALRHLLVICPALPSGEDVERYYEEEAKPNA